MTADEMAQALAARFGITQNGLTTAIANAIRAAKTLARSEGLKEAAAIADHHSGYGTQPGCCEATAIDIQDAIRALAEDGPKAT